VFPRPFDWTRSGFDGTVSGVDLIGYMGYFDDNWYWDNALGYGLNYFRNKRKIAVGSFNKKARSSHMGHAIIGSSQLGYGFELNNGYDLVLLVLSVKSYYHNYASIVG